ncbi:MAG TPA: YhjD/YihY/BrkB family envelope integrity protein [Actinomycetota bacterium]
MSSPAAGEPARGERAGEPPADEQGSARPAGEGERAPRRVRQRAEQLRGRADTLRRQATTGIETASGRYPTVRWILEAYDRDKRRFGGMLAGGLAFKLFLWLLPYALMIVSLLGYASDYSDQPPDQLAKSAGLSSALVAMVAQAVEDSGRGRIFLLVLGGGLALWSGRGLVRALAVINTAAWDLPIRQARGTWKGSAFFLGFATLLFGSQLLGGSLYAGSFGTDVLASTVLIALFSGIWLAGAVYLPRPEDVPWTALIPGAVVLGVSVRVVALVTSVYLAGKLARVDDLYGSLGIATVFLAWLFIASRVIVAATFLNASRWFAAHPPPADAA